MWPVRYNRMFDMTNDSHLFRTAARLDAEGFYPVEGNLWKRGEELYLPLYEGKMVQAFDHRAASVVVNPENLNRPAQPREATLEEHTNPNWLPESQFWVNGTSLASGLMCSIGQWPSSMYLPQLMSARLLLRWCHERGLVTACQSSSRMSQPGLNRYQRLG